MKHFPISFLIFTVFFFEKFTVSYMLIIFPPSPNAPKTEFVGSKAIQTCSGGMSTVIIFIG